jgi:hypothetical protein
MNNSTAQIDVSKLIAFQQHHFQHIDPKTTNLPSLVNDRTLVTIPQTADYLKPKKNFVLMN